MKLSVCKEEVLVGEIFTTEKSVCFSYDENYCNTSAFPLSISLPIQEEPHSQNVVLPFFEGLLPEGTQRQDLGSFLHVSTSSTMKLLQALAGECVGNLIILESDETIANQLQESSYVPLSAQELEALLRPQSLERARFVASRRLSLAGAQAKFGLYSDSKAWFSTKGLAPTTHIIKPASTFDSSLLINEFFMMQLAKNCDIVVPETSVIRSGANHGFVVRRFDRRVVAGKVVRLGQEDFCQALSVMPVAKYENDGGPGFKSLFATILRNTARPIPNIQMLLRIVLFNYLIGNCDAHAKNFSLLQNRENGALSLAPAYDLVCTTFYGDRLSRSMAMKIGNHSKIDRISAQDFALFSEEIGVHLGVIAAELGFLQNAIVQQVDNVLDVISAEATEYLAVAKQLREFLLEELEKRVLL